MGMRLVTIVVGLALCAAVAACNTIEGMGKDVKATGAAVEKAAEKARTN